MFEYVNATGDKAVSEVIKRKDNEIKELRKTIDLQDKALNMDKHGFPKSLTVALVIGGLIVGFCLGITIASEVIGGLL